MAEHGLKQGENDLEIYAMCELPANVVFADEFLEVFDGYSIGSNDLTQLALGLDRDCEMVAHLFDERNGAVEKMVAMAIDAAKRAGKKIGICGQAPSDYPEFAEFLVKRGINSISLNPDTVIQTTHHILETEQALRRQPRNNSQLTTENCNFSYPLSVIPDIESVNTENVEPPENYIPQNIARKMRKQAVMVWLIGLAVVSDLGVADRGRTGCKGERVYWHFPLRSIISSAIFATNCRSVRFMSRVSSSGFVRAVLAFILGSLLGFVDLSAVAEHCRDRAAAAVLAVSSMIPIGVDWSLTIFGIWENTQFSRACHRPDPGFCVCYIVYCSRRCRRDNAATITLSHAGV